LLLPENPVARQEALSLLFFGSYRRPTKPVSVGEDVVNHVRVENHIEPRADRWIETNDGILPTVRFLNTGEKP